MNNYERLQQIVCEKNLCIPLHTAGIIPHTQITLVLNPETANIKSGPENLYIFNLRPTI